MTKPAAYWPLSGLLPGETRVVLSTRNTKFGAKEG